MSLCKDGDLIIFDDKHKLLCGDATNYENYNKLLENSGGGYLLYTDPPYNASFNGRSGDFEVIKNDNMDDKQFNEFILNWYTCIKNINFKAMYIFCNNYLKHLIEDIDTERWVIRNKRPIIWVKNNFGMGSNYRPKYEMLMFDGEINKEIKNECDVWNIPKDNGDTYIHPTQKPIESFLRGINNHTDINIVIDTFAGSGTSLIASQICKKQWLGMELDNIYCDRIIRRYYDYTFSDNIKIIRNKEVIEFETIKEELKLLYGAKKGSVTDDSQTRLF